MASTEKIYEAIKTRFDDPRNGVSGVASGGYFTELYTAEPPDPTAEPLPFCVMTPGDSSLIMQTFRSKYLQVTIDFHVVAGGLDDMGTYDAAIESAFDDPGDGTIVAALDADSALSGIELVDIAKVSGAHNKGDFIWESVQTYRVRWRETK